MRTATHLEKRPVSPGAALALAAGLLLAWTAVAEAQEAPNPPVRVEEDWVLVVNEPKDSTACPQFHTTMSPLPTLDGAYAQVTWNYRYAPDFMAGGLQLHSWVGETEIRMRGVRTTLLSTTAETITWTQALETTGSVVDFSIIDGHSTTWGYFGRDMQISADAVLEDLSTYDPAVSVGNSWITFGSNRVDLLMITQVRYYDDEGELLKKDQTSRIVYQAPQEEPEDDGGDE